MMAEPWENDPILVPAEEVQGRVRTVAGPDGGGNPWDADPIVEPRQPERPIPSDDGVRPSMEQGLKRRARKMRGVNDPGKASSVGLGFLDWGGMGWADEAVGGLGAALSYLPGSNWGDESFGDRYSAIKRRYEDNSDAAWEKHPWLYAAGAVPGFVGSAVLTPEIKGATALTTGAKTGAVWGGISGAGQGDDWYERVLNAGLGTGLGTVGGAAFGWGADKAGRYLTDRAARRALEDVGADTFADEARRFGIRTSRGQRTGDVYTQAIENSMADTGMGDEASRIAQRFRANQGDDIAAALDDIGGRIAGLDPATGVPRRAISAPHEGGEILDDAIRSRVTAETRGIDASNAAEVRRAQSAGDAIELGLGKGSQLVDNEFDLGNVVGRGIRDRQAASAAARDAAYERAAGVDARIDRKAIDGIDQRIMEDLTYNRDQPVVVNDGTPRAKEALSIISDVAAFRAPRNAADPMGLPDPASITHISPLGIETVRKRLVALARQASSAGRTSGDFSDAYAMRAIMQEFDEQLERAVQYGLFEGDPAWLDAYRQARSLHRQHRATYRPEDDLKTAMRAIVERDATPEQVANYLFGRSRLGDNAVSAKLAGHLQGVLGKGSEEWAAIRQAAWQRLLTTGTKENATRAVTPESAARIASQIQEFTSNRGRSLALQLFDPAEITIMNRYANGLRSLAGSQRTPPEALQTMIEIAEKRMNPQRLAEILTGGQQALGKNDKTWHLVEAAEQVFGRDSEEWSVIRQTVWQQLVKNPEGKDAKGPKQIANRIFDFVNGPGAPAAKRLFTPEERSEMLAIAGIVRRIAGANEAKNPPRTAGHLNRLLADRGRQFLAGLGFISGGADAGVTAFAAAQGSKMALDAVNAKRANRLFAGARDISISDGIKSVGSRAALRNARRGQRLSPFVSGRELAPAVQSGIRGAAADEEEQRP
jgi:hypothetical protein